MDGESLTPRDVVKLALQYQETERVPYTPWISPEVGDAITAHVGDDSWQEGLVKYIDLLMAVDNFLSKRGLETRPDGAQRDCLGCVWMMGTTHHLVDGPLHEPVMGKYRLPDLGPYFEKYIYPEWPGKIAAGPQQFRIALHSFGLFERAWSLRGFENFMMDMADPANEKFVEELLGHITEWLLESVDLMARGPVDAIMLTDDHAAQRGMLMGAGRWRRFFKPRWKRIYERSHHYGLYSIMHMCGDNEEVIPDLIEIGLDCAESCQPEAMDIYKVKREYGRDIRFWGGLGVQSVLPFGTPAAVREETRRLKQEMRCGGGYILGPAKAPGLEVPVENIVAFLEEAKLPRT